MNYAAGHMTCKYVGDVMKLDLAPESGCFKLRNDVKELYVASTSV